MTEPAVQYLNDVLVPAKGKEWGCRGCKLFQYAPCFTKADREVYQATLDPERREKKNATYKMASQGPDDAETMALMDWPTKAEDESGRPFAGGGAKVIKRNASISGIDTDALRWTYMVRCRPQDDTLTAAGSAYCSRFLAEEIARVKPKNIIVFGQAALTAILGKSDAKIEHYVCNPRNVTLAGHQCVVYPMQAPWYIFKNSYLAGQYQEHFDKLAAFLRGDTGVRQDDSLKNVIIDPNEAIKLCERMIARMEAGYTVEVDLETSGLNPFAIGSRISVVSLCSSTKIGYAIMFNHDEVPWSDEDRARVIQRGLKPLLKHRSGRFRLHNGKFDYQWIRKHFGFWPRDIIEDTMLTHYAVDENVAHGLKPLALLYTDMGDYDAELDKVLDAQTYPDAPRYDLVDWKLLGKYAAMDGIATRKLANALAPEVERQGEFVQALARRAMPAFSATLTRMEYNGMAFDADFAAKQVLPYLQLEAKKSYDVILSQPTVRQFIRDGEEKHRAKMKRPKPIEVKQYFNFSLGSPTQLKTLLYDEKYYNHTPTVFSDSGEPSTDKEAMTELVALKSPIATAIMEHRLDQMLIGTFVEPNLKRCIIQGDQFVHGQFSLIGTKTGRLASRNPNCFSGDTEVLTPSGWVRFDEYDGGTLAQWDAGKVSFVKPDAVQRINAPVHHMQRIENEHISLDVTDDHRCLVRHRKTGALRVFPAVDYPEDWQQLHGGQYAATRVNPELTPDLVRLLVATQADGSFVHNGGIDFGFKKSRKYARLVKLLDACGVPWTPTNTKGRLRLYVPVGDFVNTARRYLGAGRVFGDWLLNLSSEAHDAFLDEVWFWDGVASRRNHYASKDKVNADWVQTLCALRGQRAKVRYYENSAGGHAWIVDVTRRDYSLTTNVKRTAHTKSGTVYCVSVPSSYVLVRRNGAVMVTGQCQNIPNKGAGLIKRLYVSRYGEDGVFLQIDFSQIELRILAALSNDPNMIEAYRTGKDLHMMTACLIFNMTEAQFTELPDKEQKRRRTIAKRVNFGIAYGIGGPGIMGTLKSDGVLVTEDEARSYLDSFFEKYPRVEKWIESVERSTDADTHSLSMFGRRRRLLAVRSEDDGQVAQALRQGVNHVIQSTAGDLTMTALCLMDQEICIRSGRDPELILPTVTPRTFERDDRWKRAQLVVQVHDMIGIDCHKDVAADVTDRLLDTMQNVVDYAPLVWGDCVAPRLKVLKRVPILAEAEVGPNWRDASGVKTGADVPRAMFVARAKRAKIDAEPKYKWGKEDDKAVLATYKDAA